jgi:hypothetical protein
MAASFGFIVPTPEAGRIPGEAKRPCPKPFRSDAQRKTSGSTRGMSITKLILLNRLVTKFYEFNSLK